MTAIWFHTRYGSFEACPKPPGSRGSVKHLNHKYKSIRISTQGGTSGTDAKPALIVHLLVLGGAVKFEDLEERLDWECY